jgi:hypothetical protein
LWNSWAKYKSQCLQGGIEEIEEMKELQNAFRPTMIKMFPIAIYRTSTDPLIPAG